MLDRAAESERAACRALRIWDIDYEMITFTRGKFHLCLRTQSLYHLFCNWDLDIGRLGISFCWHRTHKLGISWAYTQWPHRLFRDVYPELPTPKRYLEWEDEEGNLHRGRSLAILRLRWYHWYLMLGGEWGFVK